MKVYELIEELKKIPNQNLDVVICTRSKNFEENRPFKRVEHNVYRCMLVRPVNDEFFFSDEELEEMKDNHEIW